MLYVLFSLMVALALFMAAPKAFRESSVSWKGSPIVSVKDVSETETTGGVVKHRADNATTNQAVFVDSVGATVRVTVTDISLRGTAGYTVGANGILVVVSEQRAEGIGAVGGANKTHTYGDATLISIENGAPIEGVATLVLTFECVDPLGVACCVFS